MKPTIYASFESEEIAKHAIGALIRGGTPAGDITLACKTRGNQVQATDLNPAQDDYPRGDAATEFSSAPADSPRDYNGGIEADYNANYKEDVDRDAVRELQADQRRANELGRNTDQGIEANQEFGAMPGTFPDLRVPGPGNSSGDTSMGTPGMRYSSMAATANAGSNPDGMTDYLWDSLPVDMARYYQQEYDGGHAIVIVRTPTPEAEAILRDQGALDVQRQGYLA